MGRMSERRKISEFIEEVYAINEEEGTERKCYRIDKNKKEVIFYPEIGKFFVDIVCLDGFTSIPKEFSDNGYILAGVQYALTAAFKDKKINKFTISKDNKKDFRKVKNGYNVIIPYSEFSKYKNEIVRINTESQNERKRATQYFLATLFPKQFKVEDESLEQKKKRFLSGLDINIISKLSPTELKQVQDFVFDMLDNRYVDLSKRLELLASYKESVDTMIVDEAIKRYEENIQKGASESEWGKYIQQYLFLLETKYVDVIPELNLSLSTWRKVDFAYVDYQGYLDIFEIKKPTTELLYKTTDRGNYYWHAETVKAITQAEKYLHSAERKASSLAEDIKRETGIDADVVKPHAFLIIGSSEQLINENMRDDFRILRSSLKNIEIILYDELLERFTNLKNRVFGSIQLTNTQENTYE